MSEIVSLTVDGARPRRRAISRVATPAENFRRIISRAWRIGTLSAGIGRSLGLPKEPTYSGQRWRSSPCQTPGRNYSVPVGGIIS